MKDSINNFFSLYQLCIDNQFNAINKYPGGDNKNPIKIKHFILKWNIEAILKNSKNGIFKSIFKFSNILKSPQILPNLSFLSSKNSPRGYFPFMISYDDFFVSKDENSEKIIYAYKDYGDFINIAINEISFIMVLSNMIKLELYFINKLNPGKELIVNFRNTCIEIAGGFEYSKFYNFFILNADEIPEQLF